MTYHLYNILRLLLYPFLRFLLPLLSSSIKKRVEFELKNLVRKAALKKADIAFEISSEGEFEQVYAVVEKVLEKGRSVEILYSSQSVEHRIIELQQKYPERVRVIILPILTYLPYSRFQNAGRWLTADIFYMCRYDFFPELIQFGSQCKNFVLLSASLKNFESKNLLAKVFIKSCLKRFDKIVAVSQKERQNIVDQCGVHIGKIEVFDFRTIQIQKRLAHTHKTLENRWPLALELQKRISHQDIIFGSYWPSDFEIVKLLVQDRKVYLVPHHLDQQSMDTLVRQFNENHISFQILDKKSQMEDLKEVSVTLLNIKGLLCELYSFFNQSYVGGGFGQSVHSVLEPYMAGSKVWTGPNIYRSSEVDMIKEFDPEMILDSHNIQQLAESLKEGKKIEGRSESFKDHFIGHFEPIVSWTGIE